jgi:hypothetical protein
MSALTAEQAHALIAQLQEQNQMLQQSVAAAPAAAASLAAQTVAAALAHAQSAAVRAPPRTKIPAASNYAGSAHTLDNWLREMEQQFDWYGYNSHAERVAMAAAQLRGSALDWWHALSPDEKQPLRESFADFEQALRKRFQPVDSAKSARLALDQLAQGARQSVHDYTAHFRRLLTAVPSMSADDRVHRYVQGLRPAVRSLLLLQDVKTLDEAIASAARIGSLSQYASHASSSTGASTAGPMDLSSTVMRDLCALAGTGISGGGEDDPSATDAGDAAPSDAAPVTRAELRQMHQQLLHAMQSQRRGEAGRSSGRGGRPSGRGAPRVSGLSEQQVRERLDAGTCFACGKPGHRKADCPTAGKGDSKQQSGN